MKTAILVDGGFYRKRAAHNWGKKDAISRANELYAYCMAHINSVSRTNETTLYRIFYYDCPPINKPVYHPLLKKNINFGRTDTYNWTLAFFEELKKHRKVALRLGELSDNFTHYNLKKDTTKKLFSNKITVDEITEHDFELISPQKGVDMRIGIDIASLVFKRQVDQIILIAGDSDFVPAAKLARREGIDFILDPMWANIKDNLYEHIDGLQSQWKKEK